MKLQAADALLRLVANHGHRFQLNNAVLVLIVSHESLPCAFSTVTLELRTIKEPKGLFDFYIPKSCMKAGITGRKKEHTDII